MSQVRYPHRATKRLDDLDPLNGPRLHDRIYSDILVAGLDFRRDQAEKWQPGTEIPVEPAKPAPPAPKPLPKEAVQARLFQDGETA